MQDNSDSPRLADKTMVLGPGGDVSGHSETTTTHMHSAKTTTEQPIPCQPNIPEPPHLVSRSSALQEHGFTAEVAKRIGAPQRLSTRSIYTSKWTVFQLSLPWENLDAYVFLPVSLLGQVICKVMDPGLSQNDSDCSRVVKHAFVLGPGQSVG